MSAANIYPISSKKYIRIRNPVLCSDGYKYEERCMSSCLTSRGTFPVILQLIKFVTVCDLDEKKTEKNLERGKEAYHIRTDFHNLKDNFSHESLDAAEDVGIIYDGNLLIKIFKTSSYVFDYASSI